MACDEEFGKEADGGRLLEVDPDLLGARCASRRGGRRRGVLQELFQKASPTKILACACVALLLVTALALTGHRGLSQLSSKQALRLSQNICEGSQMAMNFGSGLIKFDLDAGSGRVTRNCPFGSSNWSGKIHFACLPTGVWNLTHQTCYDCPKLREVFTFKPGQTRDIVLMPASHGAVHREACHFDGGHKYKRGELTFKCVGNRWEHIGTTCSHTRCREGNVTLDFYGEVGKVNYHVPASNRDVSLPCPKATLRPTGTVDLVCGKARHKHEVAEWQFVRQTCQSCNPTSLTLTFDKAHRRDVKLGAGLLHDAVERDCTFDGGEKRYKFGKLVYKCMKHGWKLWKSSCVDGVCPAQIANVIMKYTIDGRVVTGSSQIRLDAAMDGAHEYKCPDDTLDPSGKVTFVCQKDSKWRIDTVSCGRGVQVHEAPENETP